MVHQVVEIDPVEAGRPPPAGDLAVDVVEPERQVRQRDAERRSPRAIPVAIASAAAPLASQRRPASPGAPRARAGPPATSRRPPTAARPAAPASCRSRGAGPSGPAPAARRASGESVGSSRHRRGPPVGAIRRELVDRVAPDDAVAVGDLLAIQGLRPASQGASSRPRVGSNSTAVSGTGGQSSRCVKPDSPEPLDDLPGRLAAAARARSVAGGPAPSCRGAGCRSRDGPGRRSGPCRQVRADPAADAVGRLAAVEELLGRSRGRAPRRGRAAPGPRARLASKPSATSRIADQQPARQRSADPTSVLASQATPTASGPTRDQDEPHALPLGQADHQEARSPARRSPGPAAAAAPAAAPAGTAGRPARTGARSCRTGRAGASAARAP